MGQCFLMSRLEMVFLAVWTSIIVLNIVGVKAEAGDITLLGTVESNRHQLRTKRQNCGETHSQVSGKSPCQGERIFHETFSGTSLNTDRWSHEVLMPTEPNYEFVVFNDNPIISSAGNGLLRIKPSISRDEFVRRGIMELNRCTGRLFTEECYKRAATYNILPPVQSARITTKNSFTFKYGKVEVRAKFPAGDWLIPEIWLEPKRRFYGPSYLSGRIRIAFSPGNKQLTKSNGDDISSKVLSSNIIMGTHEKVRGRSSILSGDKPWSNDFHNYTVIWEPGAISFQVDGGELVYVVKDNEVLSNLLGFDEQEADNWKYGMPLAPFDQEFYISLGVSVGGMKDFPDDCKSGDHPKPWKNNAVKAMLNFWEDRANWEPTWSEDKSSLQVERVTVYAL